jgi:cyclase
MKRSGLILVCALSATLAAVCAGPPDETTTSLGMASDSPPAGTLRSGPAFEFVRITDDIYHVRGTGTMAIGSNSVAIINESDVLLVDSHITPAAAWVLREELRSLTDKPVRYVVNTHFHFDHAHGNQIYGPDVEIIGHEFTRRILSNPEAVFEGRTYVGFTSNVPLLVEELRNQVEAAETSEERSRLEEQLQVQESYLEALATVDPTPPTLTLDTRMTLVRGGREIQLIFLGRGHTGGDLVVYLPEEGIVCTGDLLVDGLAYMGDAYLDEWPDALERLKELEFNTVLPGHGDAFSDRERIDNFQLYLRDFWDKLVALRAEGLSAEAAAERIDMTNHRENYPNLQSPGIDPRVMLRGYERMDELAAEQ